MTARVVILRGRASDRSPAGARGSGELPVLLASDCSIRLTTLDAERGRLAGRLAGVVAPLVPAP